MAKTEKNSLNQEKKQILEVVMLWNGSVMDVGHYSELESITIGDSFRNTFRISYEKLPTDGYPLLSAQNGDYGVLVTEGIDIKIKTADGKLFTISDLDSQKRFSKVDGAYPARWIKLGNNEIATIQVGLVEFVVQYVTPASKIFRTQWDVFDWYFPKILSFSVLLHVALLIAALLTPLRPTGLSEDLFMNPNRFAKLILEAPKKEQPKKKFERKVPEQEATKKSDAAFAKREEVKKENKKDAPQIDVQKREKDIEIAKNAGLLALLKKRAGGGAVSNVFGPGGLGTGINNAMGALQGQGVGDAAGAGGLGARGVGVGGGGGALGIGGIGTFGHGKGGGYGNVDLGGGGKGETRIVPGKIVYKGALTQEDIGRVIRRHLAQFKFCYEKELTRNPNLAGKVTVKFIINGMGKVQTAEIGESSMNDPNVEECSLRVMRRLLFPQPKGGGIVEVTYPFVFNAG